MSYSVLRQHLASGIVGILVSAMCFVSLLDISDVTFAFVGALVFLVYRHCADSKQQSKTIEPLKYAGRSAPKPSQKPSTVLQEPRYASVRRERRERNAVPQPQQEHSQSVTQNPPQDAAQPSICPIASPFFASADWEGQVNEFLQELSPTAETDALARTIACAVQDALRSAFPNIHVAGFAHGNPKSSKAFATAVPDIEIVAKLEPDDILDSIGRRYRGYDVQCVQKAAIRACTDELAYGDFKFRRSAFKYDEPKVTFVAPTVLESVPFDFSVNALTPMHHHLLLQECFNVDTRAWELVLLVHRWARDRGISHAAKGHLTPYAWTLVVLFFLQVRKEGEGALLPPFRSSSPHFSQEAKKKKRKNGSSVSETARTSVSSLLKEFMNFYATGFDWRCENISIQRASRVVGVVEKDVVEWRRQASRFQICDPFQPAANLGRLLSNEGSARLRDELARADAMCSGDRLLSQLLEPWTPAEPVETACKPTSEETKIKHDMPSKPSSRNSLTASPMGLSLRPTGAALRSDALPSTKTKVSLTASPMGLTLKPSMTRGGCNISESDSTQSGSATPLVSSDTE